mgnify:CR=1 FL=1
MSSAKVATSRVHFGKVKHLAETPDLLETGCSYINIKLCDETGYCLKKNKLIIDQICMDINN